jgi:hypothetical protein
MGAAEYIPNRVAELAEKVSEAVPQLALHAPSMEAAISWRQMASWWTW